MCHHRLGVGERLGQDTRRMECLAAGLQVDPSLCGVDNKVVSQGVPTGEFELRFKGVSFGRQ